MSGASSDAAPRRILIHTTEIAPGTPAHQLAAWLARRGVGIEVVAGSEGPGWWHLDLESGFAIHRCPRRHAAHPQGLARRLEQASFALASAPVLLRRARAFRPHILLGFEASGPSLPVVLTAARHSRAASWVHLGENTALEHNAGAGLLGHFDHVSLAAMNAAEALAAAGIAETCRMALPPWVDTRAFFPLPGPSPLRAALGLGDDAIVALYAGSLDEPHGVDQLIEAARYLPRSGAVVVVVSGRGAAWRRLAAATHSLPLRLLPWPRAENLNALLGLADIHVLPAGLATADSLLTAKSAALLASGRPILAAGVVGAPLREAVVPVSGGGAGLAAAIIALAAAPAEQLRRGAAARRAAQDYHEKERVFRQIERQLELRPAAALSAAAS